jgi:hypothetical protein
MRNDGAKRRILDRSRNLSTPGVIGSGVNSLVNVTGNLTAGTVTLGDDILFQGMNFKVDGYRRCRARERLTGL